MSIKDYKIDVVDLLNEVLGHRHALKSDKVKGIFDKRPAESALRDLDKEFDKELGKALADPKFKAEFDKLKGALSRADTSFINNSVLKDGARVARDSKTGRENFDKAKSELEAAKENFTKLLRGQGEVHHDGLNNAFSDIEERLTKAKSLFNSPFGMMKTEGITATVKHNAEGLKFWDKEVREVAGKSRVGAITARSVALGSAVALGTHAVAFSENRDGEKRNGAFRILEGAAAIAALSGALLVAKAR